MTVCIALYQPDIPGNTGTILRMAACFDLEVHIIEPAGFDLSDRALQRAGMDYLEMAAVRRHIKWERFVSFCVAHKRRIVGVNAFTEGSEKPPEILKIDDTTAREGAARLAVLRQKRDAARHAAALAEVKAAAKGGAKNVMPALIEAAHAEATLGEICDALKEVLGTWREGREF